MKNIDKIIKDIEFCIDTEAKRIEELTEDMKKAAKEYDYSALDQISYQLIRRSVDLKKWSAQLEVTQYLKKK